VIPLKYDFNKAIRPETNNAAGPYVSGGAGLNILGKTVTIQGKTLTVNEALYSSTTSRAIRRRGHSLCGHNRQ
jgi:hypothetical protein